MAQLGASMRLTVDVLPLAEENSHGPYRDVALAAFKGRKFALPVQLDDTFEKVWGQIEERYKRNYLTPAQASSFTIKVLQDSYDCDLDLSDTVRSIFSGETDPSKRMIKVVPSFVYRDFSVPLTSNLRPANAQKRAREAHAGRANKRRRLDNGTGNVNVEPDQPVPTTEDQHSASDNVGHRNADGTHVGSDHVRSKSSSIVPFGVATTGRDEFGPPIKEQSPELGISTMRTIPESEQPSPVRPMKTNGRALNRTLSMTREDEEESTQSPAPSPKAVPAQDVRKSAVADDDEESDEESEEEDNEQDVAIHDSDSPESEDDDKAYRQSPKSSSPEHIEPSPPPQKAPRKDVYEPSPSPELEPRPLLTPKNTYSRRVRKSARLGAHVQPSEESVQEESEQAGSLPSGRSGANPSAFQLAKPDDIVSTPDDSATGDAHTAMDADATMHDRVTPVKDVVNTPLSNGAPGSAKTSSLKKPTRKFTKMPPPKMSPLTASGSSAKTGSKESAEPVKRRTGHNAVQSEVSQMASTPARGRASMTPSASGVAITPKLSALDKIRLVRENASRTRRASSNAPSQAAQSRQSSVLRSQSPNAAVKEKKTNPDSAAKKSDAQPWELLNAVRKAPSEKSPAPSDHPTEESQNAAPQEQPVPPVDTSTSTSKALIANTTVSETPKKSPIPPPPVKATPAPAPNGIPTSTAKPAAAISDMFKAPAKKTAVSTPTVKHASQNKERHGSLLATSEIETPRSDIKAGSVEPKRTPIPAPGDANFLTPTDVPKPRRQSIVPLPENVRGRFTQGTASTPSQPSASMVATTKSPIPLPGALQGIASTTSQASASAITKSKSPIPLPSIQTESKRPDNAVQSQSQSASAIAIHQPSASPSAVPTNKPADKETITISSASSDSEEFTSSEDEEEEEVKQQKPDVEMADAEGLKAEDVEPENDAESLPDADADNDEDAAPGPVSAQSVIEDKTEQEPKPWTNSTWGFDCIGDQNDTDVPTSAQKPPPASLEEPAPRSTTETEPEDEEDKQIEQEEEQAIQQEIAKATNSPSPSPSTRFSPDTTLRQPARYLSRSPTPETEPESSDDEEEDAESAPSSPKAAADAAKDEIEETDSSDSSSDSSSEDEEDLSTLDISSARPNTQPATQPPQSSMPSLISTPTPMPSASQPGRRIIAGRASLPGPSTQPQGALSRTPSSQRISTSQPQSARPLGRASSYLKPREQLQRLMSDSQKSKTAKTNGSFDPSKMSLGSLKPKPGKAISKNGKAAAAKMFDDSDDESSSSSSSDSEDEDEDGGQGLGGRGRSIRRRERRGRSGQRKVCEESGVEDTAFKNDVKKELGWEMVLMSMAFAMVWTAGVEVLRR